MAQAARRRPPRRAPERRDPPVAPGASLTVLQAVKAYKQEAQYARRERLQRNRANWDGYLGLWDWSHKQKGQSREALPKVAMAVEQLTAVFKRGLTDFGDWFALDLGGQAQAQGLSNEQARALLMAQLNRTGVDFPTVLADAIKSAFLGSLLILKVYGVDTAKSQYTAERGVRRLALPDGSELPQIRMELVRREVKSWQLVFDAVPPEDYYPDPTGRRLYEIHTVERDLYEVQDLADKGLYDVAVVNAIEQDFARREEEWLRLRDRGAEMATPPEFRKRVVIDECWGTLLRPDGRVAEANIVTAVANEQFLIRPPEPNPFWHGESPFVVTPLVRVPFTVWHRALMDDVLPLNEALNELFNLMLDGGIASVWGNKQVRPDYLEDPRQISDGIPPGLTLVVKDGVPAGAKALEQVATGQVPADARIMYELVDRELQTASQVNAVKLGQIPPSQTTATAIVEAEQSAGIFFDSLIRDVEDHAVEPALKKGWMTYMQYLEQTDAADSGIVDAIGPRAALLLSRMSAAERFAAFGTTHVKVSGLSAVQARMREFKKLLALMGAVGQNPVMMQALLQTASPGKL